MRERQMGYIAIIEDDALVRDGLRDCMESAGFSVEAFGSAEEFLAWKPSQHPSCLIVDIQLPGASGLELQRKLVAIGNPTPMVFVTAHGTDPNREQAVKNGAAAFLSKPVRRQELLNAVTTAIQR